VTIKKPYHIKPFVAPKSAKTDKDLYRGSATIDTNNPYRVYLLIQKVQDHVFTIMDKKDATDYKSPFIDQDICTEIDNLTNPAGNKFKLDNLPPDFPQDLATAQANDDPNKDRIPVLCQSVSDVILLKETSKSTLPKWHVKTTTKASIFGPTPSTTSLPNTTLIRCTNP
jgi:hypothetical protein